MRTNQLRSEYFRGGSYARQGNLIAAWQSASASLDEIHDRTTGLILEAIIKREASRGVVDDKDKE